MYPLGLREVEQKQYHALLQTHHTIDVRLQIMDLDHKHITDISARLLDGQTTFDAAAAITRATDLDILDPERALHLDKNSPAKGALFADRMIRVVYRIESPDQTQSFSVPTFTGPITRLDRNGALVEVECMGKEIRGLQPMWKTVTFKKGLKVTTVIRRILTEIMGETKLAIPNLDRKLPKKVSIGGDKLPWQVAKKLARGLGYLLFYDGSGTARMRRLDSSPVFTFKQGSCILTEPEIGYDINKVVNAVEVWGKVPKKGQKRRGKRRPHARRVAPKNNAFSPRNLGRKQADGNTVPLYLPLVIEDDSVRTDRAAKKLAREELKRGLLQNVEVAYDSLVIPHLEELDVVRTSTEKFAGRHRLVRFAVGYSAGAVQTVGYVRNVRVGRRAARLRRKPSRSPGRNRS